MFFLFAFYQSLDFSFHQKLGDGIVKWLEVRSGAKLPGSEACFFVFLVFVFN